jgi:hypothetical protein
MDSGRQEPFQKQSPPPLSRRRWSSSATYPLTQVVRDIEHALHRRSFGDRLKQHLAEYLDEGSE